MDKKEIQKFLKRLRFNTEPNKIRYFGVGEYGDRSFRPHYHVIIFGLSMLSSDTIGRCWKKGFFHLGEVNESSANYICGYVLKKTLKLEKKHPIDYGKKDEFLICSKELGYKAISEIAEKANGFKFNTIRYGGNKLPMGRKLKEVINKNTNADWIEKLLQFRLSQENYAVMRVRKKGLKKYDKKGAII